MPGSTSEPCSTWTVSWWPKMCKGPARHPTSSTLTAGTGWYLPRPAMTRPWTIAAARLHSWETRLPRRCNKETTMLRFALAGLLSLAAMVPVVQAQEGGKRVALIIGNDAYAISPLKNAVNDARAMDAALRASNFRTILVENAKKADMESRVGEFLDMLGPDDTALFFYAGHGVQIANENFLVPVDFVPGNSLSSAKFSCMSVAQILDELNRKRARKNIVILDACRSNPVTEKYSLEAGLAQPQNPGKETYIAFSTGPGQVAADNPDGRNSWFTEALSEYVAQPTLTVELNEIFNKVKKRVSDATGGRQTPWTISSLTSGFYFHAPLNRETENDPTLAEKWLDDARSEEHTS